MPDTDLDTEVKRLLNARRGDWPRVCQSANISHSWISKFVRGDIPSPRYSTLKKLHEALTSGVASAAPASTQAPAPKAA